MWLSGQRFLRIQIANPRIREDNDGFLGLRTVYDPSHSEAVIDIGFVHGVGFDPLGTWRSNDLLWPRDLLKDDATQARVLIYDYSLLLKTKNIPLTVQALGGVLLGEVSKCREDEITATRPLVFVAHSLGGLVVKSVG
ncbi:hypothetical protein MMC13_002815 [Lambiella insularis]|nr:hypothetical protein [Lambiella insularis]